MIDALRDFLAERRAWIAGVALALAMLATCTAIVGGEPKPVRTLPEPLQTELETPLELAAPPGFSIVGTDEYAVEALVLSRERYRFDAGAKLAPVDFLLGWGRLAGSPDVETLRWSQGERWGTWRYADARDVVLPLGEITVSVANTHIVPAADRPWVRDDVLKVRAGDVVRLEGYLVRIAGPNGWRWQSSRTRADAGDGSCELFYVTSCERLAY